MARRLSGAQGGGSVATKALGISPTQSGSAYRLRAPLKAPVTWSKVSGDANLTVVNGYVVLAAAIQVGQTQSIVVRGSSGTAAVEFEIRLTGSAGNTPALAITLADGSALQFSDGTFLEFSA